MCRLSRLANSRGPLHGGAQGYHTAQAFHWRQAAFRAHHAVPDHRRRPYRRRDSAPLAIIANDGVEWLHPGPGESQPARCRLARHWASRPQKLKPCRKRGRVSISSHSLQPPAMRTTDAVDFCVERTFPERQYSASQEPQSRPRLPPNIWPFTQYSLYLR